MSRLPVLLIIFLLLSAPCLAQEADGWYNTDSLLTRLSRNKKIKVVLNKASGIYIKAGVDTANISLPAFELAYLEKWLIDSRQYPLTHRQYRKKHILTIVDYTRLSNARRFMTIDVLHNRILFDTLVAQGSGRGALRNDKYCLPVYFSNALNSDCSSPGMAITTHGTHPDNPCHLCRYSLSRKHDCVVVLEGLEKGINDNLLARDVVIHTTGSYSFGTDSLRRLLGIKDTLYRVVPESCECCTGANGKEKSTSAYATICGIEENGGYIGQSNGCLVLPEDDHIDIMRTVKDGSLIFVYSNAITNGSNYFRYSPIVRRLVRMGR